MSPAIPVPTPSAITGEGFIVNVVDRVLTVAQTTSTV
jgi:hypothetical protein